MNVNSYTKLHYRILERRTKDHNDADSMCNCRKHVSLNRPKHRMKLPIVRPIPFPFFTLPLLELHLLIHDAGWQNDLKSEDYAVNMHTGEVRRLRFSSQFARGQMTYGDLQSESMTSDILECLSRPCVGPSLFHKP